jgi:hypothetical protein
LWVSRGREGEDKKEGGGPTNLFWMFTSRAEFRLSYVTCRVELEAK